MKTAIAGPSAGQTVLYSLPQLVVAFVTLGMLNYAPAFYSQERALDLALISQLILISRLSDAFTDPVVGALSDRTRSRFGRRKPWILAGTPLFLASIWFLFNPPQAVGGLYFFCWFSLAFLGITFIQLPYVSWGAELSSDYHGRTRVAATREGIGLLGSISALLVAIVWAVNGDTTLGTTLTTMAIILLVAVPVTVGLAMLVPSPPPAAGERPLGFGEAVKAVAANKPFGVFLLGMFISFMAISPGGAMNYFLFDHIYGRPDLQAVSVLGEFAAAIVALPLWNKLSKRLSKGKTLGLAYLWIGGFTCFVPLMGDLFGVWGVMGTAAFRALALGAVLTMPYAILADVVDVDTIATGRERTGLYMAVAGVVVKVSITIGFAASFALPDMAGFVPSVRTNDDFALWSVEAVFSYLPGIIWALALPVFWFFPLGPKEVAANRAIIDGGQF